MNSNHLAATIAKKIIILIISVLVLSMITFAMSRLAPGDPLVSYYGDRVERMSPEEHANAIERLGLDGPMTQQYADWFKAALQGDYGISFKYKQPVMTVISGRLINTLLLGGTGFILTFLFALLIAVLCAFREGSLMDRIICKVGTITSCIPEFWLALVLILLFSVTWHLLPSSGAYALGEAGNLGSRLEHLILPLAVVVLSHLWYYAYMLRNKLLAQCYVEALCQESHAYDDFDYGDFNQSHSRRHLYCGDGFLLSGNRNTEFRKRQVP